MRAERETRAQRVRNAAWDSNTVAECNPHYDRVALVGDLKARLSREIEWVSPEAGDLDLVLAIAGCETACADLRPFEGVEIRIITCAEDVEGFILEMERA